MKRLLLSSIILVSAQSAFSINVRDDDGHRCPHLAMIEEEARRETQKNLEESLQRYKEALAQFEAAHERTLETIRQVEAIRSASSNREREAFEKSIRKAVEEANIVQNTKLSGDEAPLDEAERSELLSGSVNEEIATKKLQVIEKLREVIEPSESEKN